jgi:hypothetical protein
MPDGAFARVVCAAKKVRKAPLWPIVRGRPNPGDPPEPPMSHQPPKENKKKAQHTAKEKKAIKQQKKQGSQPLPFIKT